MVTSPHVVVVEDEATTRSLIAGHFASEGYRVSQVTDATSLRSVMASDPAHLVSLDIRLPDEDGISILRDLGARPRLGIMVVTRRNTDEERLRALELGADDYLVKPVNERELLLRARNILRRLADAPGPRPSVLEFGDWRFDSDARSVRRPDGQVVQLTRGEFELLSALAEQAPGVVSRAGLLEHITHRGDVPSERTVDVLVGRLRRKIEREPPRPRHIQTRHGRGYVFLPES